MGGLLYFLMRNRVFSIHFHIGVIPGKDVYKNQRFSEAGAILFLNYPFFSITLWHSTESSWSRGRDATCVAAS